MHEPIDPLTAHARKPQTAAGRWWRDLKHVLTQWTLAFNQMSNATLSLLFPGAWHGVWADETLSCRTWRAYAKGLIFGRLFRPVIDALFFWQRVPEGVRGHCHWAYLKEQARYNSPPELRP